MQPGSGTSAGLSMHGGSTHGAQSTEERIKHLRAIGHPGCVVSLPFCGISLGQEPMAPYHNMWNSLPRLRLVHTHCKFSGAITCSFSRWRCGPTRIGSGVMTSRHAARDVTPLESDGFSDARFLRSSRRGGSGKMLCF